MREANLTHGQRARVLRGDGDRWRPVATQLAARFAADGGGDEGMIRAAIGVILAVERHCGSQGSELTALVVPLVIRALRRRRRDRFRRRSASVRPCQELQLTIANAESVLFKRLRRSPTVDEVASYLNVAEHQVIAGLEAGWSAGSDSRQPIDNRRERSPDWSAEDVRSVTTDGPAAEFLRRPM
jgi:DNA-directed RNA polymerase specialized sigma subunit